MTSDGKVLSADGHIDLSWVPGDIFTEGSPEAFRGRLPRLVDCGEFLEWQVDGRVLQYVPGVGNSPYRPDQGGAQVARMAATGLYSDAKRGVLRPTTPALRIQDQERDGVSGEVIYGILDVERRIGDLEAGHLCLRIYNDWVAEFCKAAPDRFKALACLPSDGPESAAAEVYRAASLGLHGVEIPMKSASPPAWHRDWEPLWEAVEETGLPVHFHLGATRVRGQEDPAHTQSYGDVLQLLMRACNMMANAEELGSMILSGVLERHPGLTLVMGETDIAWIPHFLWRMDSIVRWRGEFDLGIPLRPSDCWRRQCLATFQQDPYGLRLLDIIGRENVMWGSDYPHADSVWLRSREIIREDFAQLEETSRRAVVHDNVARVYGFA
jgi:predicted TIM-barrel fold metal-dependent hydrolase